MGKVWGVPVGGGSCLAWLDSVYVGFGWKTGNDCRSWSQMCGSWYLPMLRLRGVLYMYEHCLLDGPGLALDFLMYDIELIGDPVGVRGWRCVDV